MCLHVCCSWQMHTHFCSETAHSLSVTRNRFRLFILCVCVHTFVRVSVHSQVWLNKAGVFQLLGPQKASFPPSSLLPDPLSLTHMNTHLPTTELRAGNTVPEGGRRGQWEWRHERPLPPQLSQQSCNRRANPTVHIFSLPTYTRTPTDGEHPLTANVLFLCAWEDLRHTWCRVCLRENFLTQLAYVAFKEELMVHKKDGKEGEKTVAKERKPPPSSNTVFLPSEVIQGRDQLWTTLVWT